MAIGAAWLSLHLSSQSARRLASAHDGTRFEGPTGPEIKTDDVVSYEALWPVRCTSYALVLGVDGEAIKGFDICYDREIELKVPNVRLVSEEYLSKKRVGYAQYSLKELLDMAISKHGLGSSAPRGEGV